MEKGEIRLAEVTFSAVGDPADEVIAGYIRTLAAHFRGRMHIGAGTVLTGDADVFWRRYVDRDRAGARHIAHALPDHYPLLPGEEMPPTEMSRERFREVFENLGMADFRVDCPSFRVDVTDPDAVDFAALTERLANDWTL